MTKITKRSLLKETIQHIDITKLKAAQLMDAYKKMSFSARDLARATEIYEKMLGDKSSSTWLTLAGSTSAAGCMQVYVDMVKHNMIDAIVATGASIVDMDFFEALGFKHYKGTPFIDDGLLRSLYIDRIYDTFIDEEELQACDVAIRKIADSLEPRPYSSREFIWEMGKYLTKHSKKKESLVETAYRHNVPIFCPAFSDSSAGFGLVMHQWNNPERHLSIDSVKDFLELTKIKMASKNTGLLMIGGGVPKNFAQDTVVCAEVLGFDAPVHKYAVQITVADVRDGACSSSTLKEASSWGKVSTVYEQMVYAEATLALPLLAATAYEHGLWKKRSARNFAKMLNAEA
ncbi:MAG: deoxyhypusine synthase [Candidatus Kerfeldbacteria bacterium]|nr:deoxyhypusine synthase [Candidatus Kerfeldbacteria bacterium]